MRRLGPGGQRLLLPARLPAGCADLLADGCLSVLGTLVSVAIVAAVAHLGGVASRRLGPARRHRPAARRRADRADGARLRADDLSARLLSEDTVRVVRDLGTVGLVAFAFSIGAKLDRAHLPRPHHFAAMAAAVFGVPFLAGLGVAFWLFGRPRRRRRRDGRPAAVRALRRRGDLDHRVPGAGADPRGARPRRHADRLARRELRGGQRRAELDRARARAGREQLVERRSRWRSSPPRAVGLVVVLAVLAAPRRPPAAPARRGAPAVVARDPRRRRRPRRRGVRDERARACTTSSAHSRSASSSRGPSLAPLAAVADPRRDLARPAPAPAVPRPPGRDHELPRPRPRQRRRDPRRARRRRRVEAPRRRRLGARDRAVPPRRALGRRPAEHPRPRRAGRARHRPLRGTARPEPLRRARDHGRRHDDRHEPGACAAAGASAGLP